MSNIDFSRIVTADDKAATASFIWTEQVKAECSRRIYAVLDAPTVSNIQGAAIAGELSAEQMAVFKAGRRWVNAMLDTSRLMTRDADYTDDAPWPPVPAGVVSLADNY